MQKTAGYDYVNNASLSADYLRESGKLYNKASKMGIRKALDEIAATGEISCDTQRFLKNIGVIPHGPRRPCRAVLATG
ncbi:MAG: hypothetical protein KAU38_13880 [Desulfobacterales bacterium]|nr:hypothetical protein [Desulfobacterales bacterium]